MQIWMVKDPETTRIALQTHEPDESTFPRGLRGAGWEIRQGEVEEETWRSLLAGQIPPDEQTVLHRRLWAGTT